MSAISNSTFEGRYKLLRIKSIVQTMVRKVYSSRKLENVVVQLMCQNMQLVHSRAIGGFDRSPV
jgi:hypothetical protein